MVLSPAQRRSDTVSVRRRLFTLVVATALVVLVGAMVPARADSAHPDWDEWDFLRLVNRERWDRGVAPLAMFPGLRDIARQWSGVMASDGVLRHDPNLAEGVASVVPQWLRVGENVGYGASIANLHSAFMDSEHHRANLLNAEFSSAGVGVRYAGARIWVTFKFVKTPVPLPGLSRTPVTRRAGPTDRDTAIAVSQRRPPDSARTVVVAREDSFADALSGGPLAAIGQGPLLLSPTAAVPASVITEAQRVLGPGGTVKLLGGPAALSPAVEQAFASAGLMTERLAGADRFATAALVATAVNPAARTVFLASGVNFPDALSASAAAGSLSSPILLVTPDAVPADTAAYLSKARPTARYVVGGPAAVSDGTAADAGMTERVAGADRFATSAAIARRFYPAAVRVAVANGLRFQDALVAGPDASRMGAPVMLTAPGTPRPAYEAVAAVNPRWAEALVVGSVASIPERDVTLLFT